MLNRADFTAPSMPGVLDQDGRAGSRPTVALFGEWNTANLGDSAIRRGAVRFFEECGWHVRCYAIGTLVPVEPGAGTQRIDAPRRARLLDHRIKRGLRGLRQQLRMAQLLPRLAAAQAISVGGGALLADENLHFPQSLVQIARCARRLGKPLYCLGCSSEGDWSAKGTAMVREFVSACRLIAVRDEATASRLATELGTRPPVFGDFCLNERPLPELQATRLAERPMPAVNASQLPARWSAAQPAYEDALVRVAHYLARTTAPAGGIRIFTTGTAEDAIVAWRVHSRLQDCGAQLHLPHDLAHLLALLRASSVVVASRLHGAILALAQDVPVVGYSPAPKLRNFLSTLGLAHYCFAPGADPDLERWFADASYSRFCAEQRRALARARVWPARAHVRDTLAALAREVACG